MQTTFQTFVKDCQTRGLQGWHAFELKLAAGYRRDAKRFPNERAGNLACARNSLKRAHDLRTEITRRLAA